jgi:hypothetical protein
MPRIDLLSLSDDDLAALTNRGTVRSARKELEDGRVTGDVTETDGNLNVRWSDGVECQLAASAALRDGRCSCHAVGTCRHLVRMVIAYQKQSAAQQPQQSSSAGEPWDPGTIPDEELVRHYRSNVWAKIQERYREGVLVELIRSARPTGRFHLPACTVRFLVPGDPRYSRCDCAEPAPCPHVPLAVWAFRLLPADQAGGIVTNGTKALPVGPDLLEEIERTALDLLEHGVSGAPSGWIDRLTRLEKRCEAADLIWPAEILGDLAQEQHRYQEHDARYTPERVADLVGELIIRLDAIRSDQGTLPQPLIRGTNSDRPTELGTTRFMGLGCAAWPGRHSVELAAYLQDVDSGSVVALTKDFPDHTDQDRPQRSFAALAGSPAVKGGPFATLGVGQLLLRGGKRTTSFRLQPGRAAASVQPQAFAWEELQPPTLVGEFAELEARLNSLPPAVLRPRRVTEDYHVCTVAGAEAVRFDAPTQTIEGILVDGHGKRALLAHPYTTRGRAGAEALLQRLSQSPGSVRFVAGSVRRSPAGLTLHPVCVIFEEGGTRSALQPWVHRVADEAEESAGEEAAFSGTGDPLGEHLRRLQAALGELLTLGLRRVDPQVARTWQELHTSGEAVGFGRLAGRVARLAQALEEKRHTLAWDARAAGQRALEVLVLVRLVQDLAG